MWSCFHKCPCIRFRGDSHTPLDQFYEDEDNLEFEHLLANQDSTSLSALLTRNPFPRVTNTPSYFSPRMILPNEEATASANRLLLEDDENLQDAQFLPDEQISKFTELISEQGKYDEYNEVTDDQLVAEEEEARRQEEEDIQRKRQAATQVALAKGLISSSDQPITNKNAFFSIGDEESDFPNDGSTSIEFSSKKIIATSDSESQISSLNKPRNPHERVLAKDVNLDDYDDVNDFENIILRSDDYEEYYSPTIGDAGDEETINPFANILPDFSEKLGRFFGSLANSTKEKNKSREDDDDNINLNDDNLGVSKDKNHHIKNLFPFVTEPEECRVGSSSSDVNRNINGTNIRIGSLKLANRLTGSPFERSPTNDSRS
ncbi:12725_t:CDS:2 [Acaulospora colombiana]|uniref:12725_t:CDS:1 n=1 Tax=Acaulospora colombiana TaxID=27376 RepID=A0ACA9K9Z0_9GLOM|nr:12725_t:CDS:2 [Acaulospora colombiana]